MFNNIFNKIKGKLGFTEDKASDQEQGAVLVENKTVDSQYLESLEEELIRSDLGVNLSLDFVESLRKESDLKQSQVSQKLKDFLMQAFEQKESFSEFKLEQNTLNIILVVGVNGVGKTTSIAKLANKFKEDGKKVLIAAGDTFRAAAEEQLKIWAQRVGCDIVQLEEGAKSSTVVYKALEKAKNESHDILIIDTAGRLQTKANLMEELSKLEQVIERHSGRSEESQNANYKLSKMLVLDSSTGQNALSQAEHFNDATKLDFIFLSKFDGTARAGIVFSLAHNFKLPVKFIGTGETMNDIEVFNAEQFISKLDI